eukprot:4109074-Pleurochrysis_carterae.AAC.1
MSRPHLLVSLFFAREDVSAWCTRRVRAAARPPTPYASPPTSLPPPCPNALYLPRATDDNSSASRIEVPLPGLTIPFRGLTVPLPG